MPNTKPPPGEPPNLTTAYKYARRKIRIFPCNTQKRPLLDGWLDAASSDETQITEWWKQNPDALVGLPTKHLDLLVIDCDRHSADADGVAAFAAMVAENGDALDEHPVIQTPGNGEHHVFRQPPNFKIGNRKIVPGVETRGFRPENDGGYIIAPGSVLPDGRSWRPVKGSPPFLATLVKGVAASPAWLTDKFREKETPKPQTMVSQSPGGNGGRERNYAEAALRDESQRLAATNLDRNIELNNAALKLGGLVARGWLERAEVEAHLFQASEANGYVKEHGARAARATIKSGLDAGMKTPRADLKDRSSDRPRLIGNGKDHSATQIETGAAFSWSDPDTSLLDTRRGILPDFPLDVLGEQLRGALKRTAKGAGVTVAHVAVPFIGITSGLIGYARRLKATTSWFEPATCCTALVGYSGTGKTPGHNVTRKPLRAVERLQKEKEEKRKRDHETKRTKARAEYDKWKANVEEAIDAGTPAPEMPAAAVDPGKYVPVRLVVNDSTVERLAELLQARPHGIVLVRDELAALYMNMSRYNGGQDDEFWLESWNGQPHTVERMGRMLDVDHLLIGVVGGMQPDKLVASFEGDHDGKYARVLFSWPDEPEWLGLSNEATEVDTDIQNIISRILTLAEFDGDKLLPLVIGLDAEADETFAQFAQFAHQEKQALEGRQREWFAKVTAHVLRLANTLTWVEWALKIESAKPDAVSKATMQAAIRLAHDYFWPHAKACLRLIGLTERHTHAKRVLLWIRAKEKTEVSREDIRRDALGQRLDAAQTEDLLKGICTSGWLREEVTPPGPQGGKPVRRWLVNPKLHKDPTAQTALTAETPSLRTGTEVSAVSAVSAVPSGETFRQSLSIGVSS
jgi:hypothetical protein